MTRPTATAPRTSSRPPAWSAWRCVSTTASRRNTLFLARALTTASPGPVSTRTEEAPSVTRMASPCPTSSTQTRAGARRDQRATHATPHATASPRGEDGAPAHPRPPHTRSSASAAARASIAGPSSTETGTEASGTRESPPQQPRRRRPGRHTRQAGRPAGPGARRDRPPRAPTREMPRRACREGRWQAAPPGRASRRTSR